MSIPVTCSYCRASFRVKERFEGKRGKCPSCRNLTQVPTRVRVVDEDEETGNASSLDEATEADSSLYRA